MKKIKAWTITELVVAMVFIAVISGFMLTIVKPQDQSSKIYTYAAIQNLTKGIITVADEYDKDSSPTNGYIFYQNPSDSTNNTFCLQMADAFSLKQPANCLLSASVGTANLVLANGIEVFGLASETKFKDTEIEYKDIAVDIDGKGKGINKLGIDRFPLRIFKERIILPTNCIASKDKIYDYSAGEDKTVVNSSEYCKTGKEFNGSSVGKNFLLDENIITYDIFRGKTESDSGETEEVKADIIASSQSAAAAMCGAYGGKRYISVQSCATFVSGKPFKVLPKCPSEEICNSCASSSPSICPQKLDGSAQTNETTCKEQVTALDNEKYSCVFLLHKPSGGMSMMIEGLIGDMDMD